MDFNIKAHCLLLTPNNKKSINLDIALKNLFFIKLYQLKYYSLTLLAALLILSL